MTIGEKYDPPMEITDQQEADRYLEELVTETMKNGWSRGEATRIERENLGYWAGYYTLETRTRVEKLFGAFHPLLPATDLPQPSQEALILLGFNRAKRHSTFPWPRR